MSAKRLLFGLAAGAGLMYLLDPANGKARRHRLGEKLDDARSRFQHRLDDGADEAGDVVQGEYLDTYQRSRKRTDATARDGQDRVPAAEAGAIVSSASD